MPFQKDFSIETDEKGYITSLFCKDRDNLAQLHIKNEARSRGIKKASVNVDNHACGVESSHLVKVGKYVKVRNPKVWAQKEYHAASSSSTSKFQLARQIEMCSSTKFD